MMETETTACRSTSSPARKKSRAADALSMYRASSSPAAPNAGSTSTTSSPGFPTPGLHLDERWQRHHQTLAADLGAVHKVARFGGHYIQKDDPTIVAESIDDLIDAARQP